jgi:alpha-1,3-rhamnosyl/mannosyltransferase
MVRRLWPDVIRRVPDAELVEMGEGCSVPDRDVPEHYRVARVVAMPSYLEGFGLPVLEAMASGRPVVSSNRGALTEFGIETTDLLYSDWVDRLAMLLTDDREWHREASRNLALSQRYSWERTASDFASLWRRLN